MATTIKFFYRMKLSKFVRRSPYIALNRIISHVKIVTKLILLKNLKISSKVPTSSIGGGVPTPNMLEFPFGDGDKWGKMGKNGAN